MKIWRHLPAVILTDKTRSAKTLQMNMGLIVINSPYLCARSWLVRHVAARCSSSQLRQRSSARAIGIYHPDITGGVGIEGISAVQGPPRREDHLAAVRRCLGVSYALEHGVGELSQGSRAGAIRIDQPDIPRTMGIDRIGAV